MSDEPGFLSRWSRRKRETLRGQAAADVAAPDPRASGAPAPAVALAVPILAGPALPPALPPEVNPPPVALADPSAPGAVPAEPPDAEGFDVSSLPPVDLLDAASDFTAFLKPGVPAALRSAALRKAWTADPLIRAYLSPLDYGWDFNAPGGLPFGFSDTLAEGADKVLQLIRQAVGEPEPAPAEDLPEPVPLEELPPGPLPMAEAAMAEPPELEPEPDEPPRRRHGGALPT